MATVITAGNATNGLTFTTDNTGSLDIKTGTGAGTTAISISSSQVATFTAAPIGAGMLTLGTSVSASGTSVNFTDVPSWVKRITVMFSGVSTSGTSLVQIQIGAGSVTNTGYLSYAGLAGGSNAAAGSTSTTGFLVDAGAPQATWLRYGVFNLLNVTGNTWVASPNLGLNAASVYYGVSGGGSLALAGVLDRIRITTVNGTDTFDAGTINILYE
jgi:hypothetical protein